MTSNDTPLYDWAADVDGLLAVTPRAEVEPYRPPLAPAVVPPIAAVVQRDGQQPYYAHIPAPLPAYDPLPQRMAGCGIMAFGIGVGAGVAGLGCGYGADLMFTGMSHATSALIGLAAAFAAGAVMLLVLRASTGVRISNFHQGDGASFRVGR
jgi:hypothetical protein